MIRALAAALVLTFVFVPSVFAPPVLAAGPEDSEACPKEVYYDRQKVGAFQYLGCVDFCFLTMIIDGEEANFLVDGDAKDFTAEEGTRVLVTIEHQQIPNPYDTPQVPDKSGNYVDILCVKEDVVTSIMLAE